MQILLSETVTHFHKIELSDEIDIEQMLRQANCLKNRCDTGYEAVANVLEDYKNKFGFEYIVTPNVCGTEFDSIDFERELC